MSAFISEYSTRYLLIAFFQLQAGHACVAYGYVYEESVKAGDTCLPTEIERRRQRPCADVPDVPRDDET